MKKTEAIKRYGKKKWNALLKTGWLDGITVRRLSDGDIDIPEYDLERAELALKDIIN